MESLRVEIAPGAGPDDDESTWTWVDITDPWVVEPVVITKGRSDESSVAGPSSLTLTLRNDDGRFSTRNPLGPWYGKIGLNTPIRVMWGMEHRFHGFLSELPMMWNGIVEVSRVTVRADGVFRRWEQGAQPLRSALTRSWSRRSDAVAYWPGEDGPESGSVSSPMRGVAPFTSVGLEFAAVDGPPGSDRLMRAQVGTKNVMGRMPAHPSTAGYCVQLLWRMDEQPVSRRRMIRVDTTSSTLAQWRVSVTDTQFQVQAFDNEGAEVINSTQAINLDVFGQWVMPQLLIAQSGSSVNWTARVLSSDPALSSLQSLSATQTSSRVGRITHAGLDAGTLTQERYVGHILVLRRTTFPSLIQAVRGYPGERAAARLERLCDEEGLDCTIIGDPDTTMPMGPQRIDTLIRIMRDVEATDGGILTDCPLTYRTRASRYNQDAAMVLGETDLLDSPSAPDDDRYIRNDITASSPDGTSARAVDESHIARFRRYEESVSANPDGDRLPLIASHRLHLGTTEEIRWLGLGVRIHPRSPHLEDEWLALRVGDRLTAKNCFPQLPGLEIDTLVEGWTEELRSNPDNVRLDINTTPAAPYRVWELEHETFGPWFSPRPYLAADVSDAATSFDVIVPVQRALNPLPDFEREMDVETSDQVDGDWNVSPVRGTFVRSQEQAFRGRWSGKFTPSGSHALPYMVTRSGGGMAVPGQLYRMSAWLFAPNGSVAVNLWLMANNNLGPFTLAAQQAFAGNPVTIPQGVWTRVSFGHTFTAAGQTAVGFQIVLNGTPSSSAVLHVDDAEVGRPGAPFATSGIFPMPITIGGEVMTVTAIGADDGTGKQTFTVTRAVNGVAKPHKAGELVKLHPGHVVAL